MRTKLRIILFKNIRCNSETEIDAKEKFYLERIQLGNEDTPNLGVVGVVVVCIIKELGWCARSTTVVTLIKANSNPRANRVHTPGQVQTMRETRNKPK